MQAYIIVQRRDGSQAIHHPSWGATWITLKPNGEIDVHARKVEREPVRQVKAVQA